VRGKQVSLVLPLQIGTHLQPNSTDISRKQHYNPIHVQTGNLSPPGSPAGIDQGRIIPQPYAGLGHFCRYLRVYPSHRKTHPVVRFPQKRGDLVSTPDFLRQAEELFAYLHALRPELYLYPKLDFERCLLLELPHATKYRSYP
jgi:hypothetical protein